MTTISELNIHVEEYLDYYQSLDSPKFAILLTGKWGCGKSWFINKYRENLQNKHKDKKCLYISLYGMSEFSQIEDSLFQQLHPILGSKKMKLAGKVITDFIKATVKIDLNQDGESDGTLNFSIPDIDFKKFDDSKFSLLIFDDLERCNIQIENLLGYINNFVESQNLKVILIANEEEIDKNNHDKYRRIKEKLIGQTLEIVPDFSAALKDFIDTIKTQELKDFFNQEEVKNSIKDFYQKGECKNLRTLHQIILNFERIFNSLPEDAQTNSELIEDMLKLLVIFSVEISLGRLHPQDISQIPEKEREYNSATDELNLFDRLQKLNGDSRNDEKLDLEKKLKEAKQKWESFQEMFKKYGHKFEIDKIYGNPFLIESLPWWQDFFAKGIVEKEFLKKLVLNSKYFPNSNSSRWRELKFFLDLKDDKFNDLLSEIKSEYDNRKLDDLTEIKEITKLFLKFSELGLYDKNKQDILKDAQKYLDDLEKSNKLDYKSYFIPTNQINQGIDYYEKESQEVGELNAYINKYIETTRKKYGKKNAEYLLDVMKKDYDKFICMISSPLSNKLEINEPIYSDFPIFAYMNPDDFVKAILEILNQYTGGIIHSLKERYKGINKSIKILFGQEKDFFEKVIKLLQKEIEVRKGKVSGHLLTLFLEEMGNFMKIPDNNSQEN